MKKNKNVVPVSGNDESPKFPGETLAHQTFKSENLQLLSTFEADDLQAMLNDPALMAARGRKIEPI